MKADTRRRWLWAAVLLVAFAVGVTAGGYAANQRAESQDVPDLAAMIALEYVEPAPAGRSPGHRLGLSLYNMGDSAVTVREARPLGWTAETGAARTVPPRQWTAVPLSITPDCDDEPGDRVRLRVNGDGADDQVTLPVRAGASEAAARHSALCSQPASTVTVEDDVETRTLDGALEMRLSLQLQGPPDASRTIMFPRGGEVAGYYLEIVRPPLTLRSGETATVTARWTVADCDDTNPLGGAPLLTVVGSAAEGPFLPDRATAALARFGAEECST